jgi:hypothetical protein
MAVFADQRAESDGGQSGSLIPGTRAAEHRHGAAGPDPSGFGFGF